MLQEIFRNSNKVWHAMYYDELVDSPDFQISYMQNADRLYFNCAHALTTYDSTTLKQIEIYFLERNLKPAIYLDSECPEALETILFEKGYREIPEELEYWYGFSTSSQIQAKEIVDPSIDFILFDPHQHHDSSLLRDFLIVNGIANQLQPIMIEKLKHNLLNPKFPDVKFICSLAIKESMPATTGLISLYKGCAYLSEGATHPDFQHQGLYTQLRIRNIHAAVEHGNKYMYVNCDRYAYSNNAYKKLGFEQIGHRRFFQKL